MKAALITYNLSNLDQYHKVLVNRALFGYTDNSNKSAYTYKRKGLLHAIPHRRLGRGVVVVKEPHKRKITELFKKYKISYELFSITAKESLLK